jgi:hypothetical protein
MLITSSERIAKSALQIADSDFDMLIWKIWANVDKHASLVNAECMLTTINLYIHFELTRRDTEDLKVASENVDYLTVKRRQSIEHLKTVLSDLNKPISDMNDQSLDLHDC